ncbi:hypothetical protein QYM36_010756 [Artemia franciscana]|uniref:LIM zinc-binding domain-containing protein n=1 Tax=Artemia franciscana TaxID=6661 RepID=A0AA88L4F2_ARTSF|nr:hypothetical protein QYM36_010756 [Artemia franciscana]
MPFKPADIPKCPKCDKSVYAAEERVAGMCGKFLDSTNCSEHDNELYCKMCHGRKYGPKGYGFGGGAGSLTMDTGKQFGNTESASQKHLIFDTTVIKAKDGEGCPRCGGVVYNAEQMLARGKAWHKTCYKCNECNKRLDSTNTCEGPDSEIYCKMCYGKNFGPKGYGFGGGAGALKSDTEFGRESYDGARAVLRPDTKCILAPEGQGCPRCGGVVYEAEKMLAKDRVFHKGCFNCHDCHRPLDSVLACDAPDKDVYCKACYGKRFGPKGFGYGNAIVAPDAFNGYEDFSNRPTLIIDTTSIMAKDGEGCPRCKGVVFEAEKILAKGQNWHKRCFSCSKCHRPLDSISACDAPDREIYCKACYAKDFGPKGFGFGHTPTLVSVTGDIDHLHLSMPTGVAPKGEGCPRCNAVVYAAEQMVCRNRLWHKCCFNCADCHRTLDAQNLCDAPDLEIYCTPCYRKKFGTHGFGYGMGAGTLLSFQ